MVMVRTRVTAIRKREAFNIIVKKKSTGRPISVEKHGVLGPYPYHRKMGNGASVEDWRRDRFEATYPGLTCDVLEGDDSVAEGQTHLLTVRNTY